MIRRQLERWRKIIRRCITRSGAEFTIVFVVNVAQIGAVIGENRTERSNAEGDVRRLWRAGCPRERQVEVVGVKRVQRTPD